MARQPHVKTPAVADVAAKQAEVYARMQECVDESGGTLTLQGLAARLVQQSQLPALCRLLIAQGLITENALNLGMFEEQFGILRGLHDEMRAARAPTLLVPRHEPLERVN